jgi:dephospho-CoA kinase
LSADRRNQRREVKVLITGMSGTGKSSALRELGRRGFRTVDTDVGDWSEWSDTADGVVWREDRIERLLQVTDSETLYVSGCVSNQGKFYDRFNVIVLLSAPLEVLIERISNRTTNDYGRQAGEAERIAADLQAFETRLRATCTHEIDATKRLDEVVEELVAIAQEAAAGDCSE